MKSLLRLPLTPRASVFLAAAVPAFLAGCAGDRSQSSLHPSGPAAEAIDGLWWVMFVAFTAVFILVVILMLAAVFRPRRVASPSSELGQAVPGPSGADRPPLGQTGFILAGGVALPVLVVIPLLFYSLETSMSLRLPDDAPTDSARPSVEVIGHQWWWEVRYPEQGIITANEIHIPVGEPVRLRLTSADVIHSFWVPRLHGKKDLIPGNPNLHWIQADEPGIYRGQCAEYCGLQHAHMAFHVVALSAEDYREWVASHQSPPPEPMTAESQRGRQVFMSAGCAQCHAIQGTEANGQIGPDLTYIGSRRTIGAGMLPNNRGNLAGWVSNAQALKPGINMPPSFLGSEDLLALVGYLESLK